MRYLSSLLFLGTGAYVLWFNATHSSRVLLIPFLEDLHPALRGDLVLQGRVTGGAFLLVGLLLLGWALARGRRRSPTDP